MCDQRLTYQQARAEIARAARTQHTAAELYCMLRQLGHHTDASPALTRRQLAHKLAWLLLPAGPDGRKGVKPAAIDSARPDPLLSLLLSLDLSAGRQQNPGGTHR